MMPEVFQNMLAILKCFIGKRVGEMVQQLGALARAALAEDLGL